MSTSGLSPFDVGILYYREFKSKNEIAESHGISLDDVNKLLDIYKNDVKNRTTQDDFEESDESNITTDDIHEMRRLRELGYNYGQIGARVGYTEETVREILR